MEVIGFLMFAGLLACVLVVLAAAFVAGQSNKED